MNIYEKSKVPLFWIRISDGALAGLMLAAVEAYALGDGRGHLELETLGLLWGTRRSASEATDGRVVFHIDFVAQSLSAKRSTEEVEFHNRAPTLMNGLIARWAPQTSLLGDFHSHPYTSLKDVKDKVGYAISDQDSVVFLRKNDESNFLWEQANNNPIMLVIAICKLGRVHKKFDAKQLSWNCFEFDLGEFRFWISAIVGYVRKDYVRTHTKKICTNREGAPQVFLDLDSKFYNETSSRILSMT